MVFGFLPRFVETCFCEETIAPQAKQTKIKIKNKVRVTLCLLGKHSKYLQHLSTKCLESTKKNKQPTHIPPQTPPGTAPARARLARAWYRDPGGFTGHSNVFNVKSRFGRVHCNDKIIQNPLKKYHFYPFLQVLSRT